MEIISKHSAIPSWEGFEYQGHIALYIAINEIFNIIECNSDINDYNSFPDRYELLIESVEDFAIKEDDKFLSIHQVKSGEFNLKENDKFCFIISLLQYNVGKGYYHISTDKLPTDFVSKTLKKIEEYLEKLRENEIKQISNGKGKKGSLEKIVYDITKDYKDSEKINKLHELEEELEKYRCILKEKQDIDFVEKHKKEFKKSEEVIEKSCKIIKKILEKVNPDGQIYYEDLYFRFVYNEIKLKLEQLISEANTKEGKFNCIIRFSDIYKIITDDHKNNNNTINYQYYEFFNLIKDEFKNYPNTNELCSCKNCDDCNNKDSCNLYCEIKKIFINEVNYEKIPEILYNLLLRTPKNNLPQGEAIRELLFKMLQEINILQCDDSNIFLAKKHDEFYRLTLVESRRVETFLELIQNNENGILHKDKTFLFESDVLITERLNSNIINYNQQGFNILGENELNEIEENYKDLENLIEKRKKDITKSKVIKIIDNDKAREILLNGYND
ncbi:MAG: ABC-three component system protein [Lachnospirales bacterium]